MPTIPASDPFANVVPEPEPIPPEEYVGGDEENFIEIGETEDDSLPVDDERYRDLDHNLVSTKLEIFYHSEGGWFIGTVSWYNSHLGKLCIVFDDGSDDYIQPDEIDGVDVILLE